MGKVLSMLDCVLGPYRLGVISGETAKKMFPRAFYQPGRTSSAMNKMTAIGHSILINHLKNRKNKPLSDVKSYLDLRDLIETGVWRVAHAS